MDEDNSIRTVGARLKANSDEVILPAGYCVDCGVFVVYLKTWDGLCDDCFNKRNCTGVLRSETAYKKNPISNRDRWIVWERDNFTCQVCGSRQNLAVDHIVPESKGGANDITNFQTLCKRCNSRKGART